MKSSSQNEIVVSLIETETQLDTTTKISTDETTKIFTNEAKYQKSNYFSEILLRSFEILFSLFFILILSPLFLLVSLTIKLETKGPILYKQSRVGLLGKEFEIYKFRSMYAHAEKNGPQWAKENDDRITKVGQIIRKTRIDELPQLVNILKGDMSLIGPRPERKIFIEQFSKELPLFRHRTLVKPGLTGWAQVDGGYDLTPKEKLEKDLFYIENKNLKFDMIIILKTIKVVISGEGAR